MVTTHKPKDANPRIKTLFVGTADGVSGLLSKESQHVFSYAVPVVAQLDQRMGIALSMPVVAESYNSTPMLPVFQTSLPEGFLKERIVDRFSKTMRIDDMALLALAGGNRVGRLRLSRTGLSVARGKRISLPDHCQTDRSKRTGVLAIRGQETAGHSSLRY